MAGDVEGTKCAGPYWQRWRFLSLFLPFLLIALFFRAALGSQENWAESTALSLSHTWTHLPLSHTWTASATTDFLHFSGTFVTINKPTWICHYHPKSIVHIRVHFWCCAFDRFWQMLLPFKIFLLNWYCCLIFLNLQFYFYLEDFYILHFILFYFHRFWGNRWCLFTWVSSLLVICEIWVHSSLEQYALYPICSLVSLTHLPPFPPNPQSLSYHSYAFASS